MDYLYLQVRDASFNENTVLRRAFREHLEAVAKALRAIEWNDSGDGDSQEDALIRACIAPDAELVEARKAAEKAHAELAVAIGRSGVTAHV